VSRGLFQITNHNTGDSLEVKTRPAAGGVDGAAAFSAFAPGRIAAWRMILIVNHRLTVNRRVRPA
jgi:hypothetical protein